MTTRSRLELEILKPTELTLLFDEPISGRSQYGEYHMYAVAVGDDEYSYFAPAEVHEQLSRLKKGDKAIITKLAAQRGNKLVISYETEVVGKEVNQHVTQPTTEAEPEEEILPARDAFFDIMLLSYRDALEISRELNGMADPEKIAVTLFIARSKSNNY